MEKIKELWLKIKNYFASRKLAKQTEDVVSSVEKPTSNFRRGLLIALLGLVIVLALAIVVFGVGIYKYNWRNGAAYYAMRVVPYPAALVSFDLIPMKQFYEELGYVEHFYAKSGTTPPADSEVRARVLNQMVEKLIIRSQARKYNITVSQQEVEEQYQKIAAENQGADHVKKVLADLYGLSETKFREYIYDQLLKEKLRDELPIKVKAQHILISVPEGSDQAKVDDANKKAQAILVRARAGEDFTVLAKQYSEDQATKDQGGELGWFSRGQMVPEVENAAFDLKVGDISEVVKSKYGFHIIKVEDRTGRIDMNFDDWLKKVIDGTKVRKFV